MSRLITLLVVLLLANPVLGQPTVEMRVRERAVYLGDVFEASVVVRGEASAIGSPSQPTLQVPGASVQSRGRSQSTFDTFEDTGGQRRRIRRTETAFRFLVTPSRPGELTIPPVELEIDGRAYTTAPIAVMVTEPPSDPGYALEVVPDRTRVYAGERVRVRFRWTFGSVRSISLVGFEAPPGVDAASADQGGSIDISIFGIQTNATQTTVRRGGVQTNAIEFAIELTPRRPGPLVLGPYTVAFTAGEGARTRRLQSRSDPVTLEVLPLPDSEKPDGYQGLIGSYGVSAIAAPRRVRVGDPIELSLVLEGPDPGAGYTPPDLGADPAFAQGFQPSPDGWRRVGRGLRFVTTVRARDPSIDRIPPIEIHTFDTEAGAYTTVRTEPIPIEVGGQRAITLQDAVLGNGPDSGAPAATPLRELTRSEPGVWAIETDPARWGPSTPDRAGAVWWAFVLGFPPLAWLLTRVMETRSVRDEAAHARRHALRLAASAKRRGGIEAGVRAFVGALRGVPPETITRADIVSLSSRLDAPDAGAPLADALEDAERQRFGAAPTHPSPAHTPATPPQWNEVRNAMRVLLRHARSEGVA